MKILVNILIQLCVIRLKDENADIESLLLSLALSSIAKYGYQSVIDEALNRLRAFMDLRMFVVYVCVKLATNRNKSNIQLSLCCRNEFHDLKIYYLTVQNSTVKQWQLRSLSVVKNPEFVQSLLEWLKEYDEVRIQDNVFPFRVVANSQIGRETSWDYLQKTFVQWYKIFEDGFLVQHLAKIHSDFVSFQKAAEEIWTIEKYVNAQIKFVVLKNKSIF
ncbi:hypothetical protein RFI_29124 [Reticulomyxa filosa]|uniref:ERAP1-like C-terminal domain-containing protein n=1 Tax=Reticulomyxa filosa TaxID=46433 RepID=X6M2V3_RETFI|nr:hypothetical protein RFI_29124 [Reticulomyxa filosa]|eukprot:ETO08264.1 hypothetical protein RFI_29124 [Reticulomyxa filosa]